MTEVGATGNSPAGPARSARHRLAPAGPKARGTLVRQLRAIAAVMPAIIIGYSALVDPLVNFDLAQGQVFGGVQLEGESKTRALTRIVMPLFLAVALLLSVGVRPSLPRRFRMVALPAIALLALACVSAIWARVPSQTLTLAIYQSVLFASLGLCVLTAADPGKVLRWVLLMFALVVAANLLTVIVRPPGSIGHQGIYTYKNTLGAAGGCAFMFGLFHMFEGRLFWRATAWFTTFGALAITLASDSKTALALLAMGPALAIAFVIFSRLMRLGPAAAGLLFLALGLSATAVTMAVTGTDMDELLLIVYGDATFTGRTHIWAFMQDFIAQSPLIGHGYRGFWSIGAASPKHASEIEFIRTIGSGHSGYFDITLNLGFVGLALLTAFILGVLGTAARLAFRPTHRSLLYLAVILFAIGRNAMESVILWSTFFDNLSFLTVAFLCCQRDLPGASHQLPHKPAS